MLCIFGQPGRKRGEEPLQILHRWVADLAALNRRKWRERRKAENTHSQMPGAIRSGSGEQALPEWCVAVSRGMRVFADQPLGIELNIFNISNVGSPGRSCPGVIECGEWSCG